MSDQDELNAATEQLARVVARLNGLVAKAEAQADKECEAGNLSVAADLRDIAGHLQGAAKEANHAYAAGRRLVLPGGIVARIGGKG